MKDNMTDEQKEFLGAEGKVVVVACPGSGKTYTVARKLLAYVDNWKEYHSGVAVLSFTNVASNEIYEKAKSIHGNLGKLGYPHFIGTVDSFIDEFIVLRYGHLLTVDNSRPRIALKDNWNLPFRYWRSECHRNGCARTIEQFYYGIDEKFYKRNKSVSCEERNGIQLPCQQYKKMLFNKGIIFQNEAAGFAYQILNKYPEIAKAVAQRFPIIIIDEVQDTSATQMAVFDMLSESGMKSMFLVGDPDQSIYEWRNANPECMIQKTEDPNWRKIELTGNFRSSQNICNATSFFSASLMGKKQSNALGAYKDEAEKPVLLLTDESDEERVIDYFLNKCTKMGITISSENVAVLTRGRIYSETQIVDLWKSKEIESFAKAAYEWTFGSRREAYREVSKAAFNVIFNKDVDEYTMVQIIREQTDEDTWKDFLINVLVDMPDVKISLEEWVKAFSTAFDAVCTKYNYKISEDKNQKEIFKIKQRDKGSTEFKKIPLWKFFEKKTEDRYTRSSIHGVKGESYDAILIYIASRRGSTITPKFLMEGNLDQELMRVAYVAMTRPRRLLMLAMPDTKGIRSCERFSDTYWTYEDL